MRRILVTGGAGFIGANFVHHVLAHTDDHVTVLDKMTYAGCPQALAGLPQPRVAVVAADVADAAAVTPLVAGADVVVHFAAETHNDRSLRDPGTFVQTNLVGTFVLLEAVRQTGVRLHHVSTDEVYGDLTLTDPSRFTEASPYRPSSPYAASKAGADHLVRAWVRSFGVRATLSNSGNNFGPWQHIEKFIPRQITELLAGRRPRVYGDGANVRDWIHVDDHCAALLAIVDRGVVGETYAIGADGERSNLEVVRTLLEIFGRPPDDLELVRDRAGHDRRYAIDAGKVRHDLGWTPSHTDFESVMRHTVDWYREHRAWWLPGKAAVEAAYAHQGH